MQFIKESHDFFQSNIPMSFNAFSEILSNEKTILWVISHVPLRPP